MPMLDIENSDEYKARLHEIKLLEHVRRYYENNQDMYSLELDGVGLRDIIKYMNDNEYPRTKQSPQKIMELIRRIEGRIQAIHMELKNLRSQEIEERKLHNLLIIHSWNNVLQRRFNGFYLNKPVIDLRRDTIVMVTATTHDTADLYGERLAIITGPGIFYTEFATDPGKYITNVREINMLLFPEEHFLKMVNAPSQVHSTAITGTINELMAVIPFDLIESSYSVQALTRGIVTRNVFHPHRSAIDAFNRQIQDKESYRPINGFKILSAHHHYYNRLLLTKPSKERGDAMYNLSSAGIAAILDNGQRLLDEIIPPKKQLEILEEIVKIKEQYVMIGHKLLNDWMP